MNNNTSDIKPSVVSESDWSKCDQRPRSFKLHSVTLTLSKTLMLMDDNDFVNTLLDFGMAQIDIIVNCLILSKAESCPTGTYDRFFAMSEFLKQLSTNENILYTDLGTSTRTNLRRYNEIARNLTRSFPVSKVTESQRPNEHLKLNLANVTEWSLDAGDLFIDTRQRFVTVPVIDLFNVSKVQTIMEWLRTKLLFAALSNQAFSTSTSAGSHYSILRTCLYTELNDILFNLSNVQQEEVSNENQV